MTRSLARTLRNLLAAAAAALPLLALAQDYQVTIDTTPLAGIEGYFAIDLLQGTAGTSNTVTLTGFSSTSVLAAASPSGNVSGALPGSVTLASTGFFNELLQAATFGAGVTTFTLSVSTEYLAGNTPDQFAVFLLDSSFAPFVTDDPTGASALLVLDLQPSAPPQVFASEFASVQVTQVPEPAPWALAAAGLAVFALRQKMRKPATR